MANEPQRPNQDRSDMDEPRRPNPNEDDVVGRSNDDDRDAGEEEFEDIDETDDEEDLEA